jgi:hypothetical protein
MPLYTLNTPHRLSIGVAGVEAASEVHEECHRKPFGEYVSELARAWNVKNTDLAQRHFLPDKVDVKLYVFSPLVMHRIPAHVDGGDAVAEHDGHGVQRAAKFIKKRTEPGTLSNDISHATVFSFSILSRNCGLPFGGPRDERVTEENVEAGGVKWWTTSYCRGAPGVGATGQPNMKH